MVQLLETGDASLSLRGVGMKDEGTYICLVSSPKHQTQHIIQLQLAGKEMGSLVRGEVWETGPMS